MKRLLMVATLVLSSVVMASSQIFTGKPLYGISVGKAAYSGGTLYMTDAASGMLYISPDEGATWTSVVLPTGSANVTGLEVIGSDVYIGVYISPYVLKYSTTTQTFTEVNTGLGSSIIVSDLASDGANLYMSGKENVYKLVSGSSTWTTIPVGTPGAMFSSIYVNGSSIWLSSYGYGLYKSLDGGTTWPPVYAPYAVSYAYDISGVGSNLYVCTPFYGVYKSSDGGINWNTANTGINSLHYGSMYGVNGNNSVLLIGTRDQNTIYRSIDAGATWSALNASGAFINNIFTTSNGTCFAYGNSGMYKSTDNGLTWTIIHNGIKSFVGAGILAQGSNIYVNTFNNGLFKSSDNGATWSVLYNGLSWGGGKIWSYGSYLFVLRSGALYRSADGGNNWTLLPTSGYGFENFHTTATRLYICGSSGLYYSVDYGNNWVQIPTTGLTYGVRQVFTDNLGNLYVMSIPASYNGDPYVYTSSNGGSTWTQYKTKSGAYQQGIRCIIMHNNTLFSGGLYGVHKFSTTVAMPVQMYDLTTKDFVSNGTALYAVGTVDNNTSYNILAKTLNNGTSWTIDGTTPCSIDAITIANSTIFVTTRYSGPYLIAGLMTRAINGTYRTSEEERTPVENVSWLYPNPARETATLKSKALIYELKVYNAAGEKMFSKNLRDEELNEYELPLQNLDKGIYFVNVVTDTGEEYLKLIKE